MPFGRSVKSDIEVLIYFVYTEQEGEVCIQIKQTANSHSTASIVTKANSKAYEKAKQFAEKADSKPFAIFGGTATGKTHLLYAVKNAIEQNSPELHVILTTTADMVVSLTNIISSGGTAEQFREQYMQADVLLVDDIQELAGKETTQDELILLFNMFYESGRRFMMTSSQKESHFGIKDRLLIRSFWGEFAVISKPYINAQLPADEKRAIIRNGLKALELQHNNPQTKKALTKQWQILITARFVPSQNTLHA